MMTDYRGHDKAHPMLSLSATQFPDATIARTGDLQPHAAPLTPAVGGEALYRHLPDARFSVLEECGHQLMLEKPLAVNAALLLERREKREAPMVEWLASLAV